MKKEGVKLKKALLIAGVVISFWSLVGFGLMSLLRQEKAVASVAQFAQVAKSQGRLSLDVTDQFTDTPSIVSAQVATVKDKDWRIEFYHLEKESQVATIFSEFKAAFEAERGNPYSTSAVSLGNFSTFSQTSNSTYYYLARVEHSFLYVKADAEYKDEIKAFVDELGY